MARVKNGFAGSFSGKLGALTGFKRFGNYYIRQSIVSNNSNTKLQEAHRTRFVAIVRQLSPFAKAWKVGFRKFTGEGKAAYNVGFSRNYRLVPGGSTQVSPSDIIVSAGSFVGVSNPALDNPDPGKLRLTWVDNSDTSQDEDALDLVYLVLYEEQSARITIQSVTRSAKKLECGYPREWSGKQAYGYVFCISRLSGEASESAYMGAVQCE